ncbi:MAG: hypothetical protein MJ238_01200 [Bacilli bacterium]|nr:hypothetical protein [Bacilli bacterium]
MFAVIDTETTWANDVMSIGVVLADDITQETMGGVYYLITPYCNHPAMYENQLYIRDIKPDAIGNRGEIMQKLRAFLDGNGVTRILAYNACFDKTHLPELGSYKWCDIMGLAGYKQHNKKIPASAECSKSGRLKRGYGVEPIYRLLSGKCSYRETHNGYYDAVDELMIVKMLGYPIEKYDEVELK